MRTAGFAASVRIIVSSLSLSLSPSLSLSLSSLFAIVLLSVTSSWPVYTNISSFFSSESEVHVPVEIKHNSSLTDT